MQVSAVQHQAPLPLEQVHHTIPLVLPVLTPPFSVPEGYICHLPPLSP